MAEQEVIKHVKAAIETARSKDTNWKHKVREILLEVAIIVFAVSLSIWLHGWAEGLRDKKDEREFLAGLKDDLKDNLQEMGGDRDYYELRLQGTRYFERFVVGAAALNKDSMTLYVPTFYANSQFNPQGSRFEALKSSGKLGIIDRGLGWKRDQLACHTAHAPNACDDLLWGRGAILYKCVYGGYG